MVVSDQDSVYVFIKVDEKWEQQDKVEASEGSRFTSTIALDGDTLAIAAKPSDGDSRDGVADGESVPPTSSPSIEGTSSNYDDGDYKDSGFVYIYTRTDGMWHQTSNLTDNTHAGGIGSSIALEGSRLVVGARGNKHDLSLSGGGSVYVYTRNDGKWEYSATLIPSDDKRYNGFGYAVALSGDTIVVGAYEASEPPPTPSPTPSLGAVTPFPVEGGGWMTPPPITRMLSSEYMPSSENEYPTLSPTLGYGSILPPTGDYESESPTPLATDIEGYGSAYVFILDSGDWTEHQILKPSDGEQDDRFGSSLVLSDDTLVIGADRGSITGVAYVYTNNKTGNWTEIAKLKPSKPDEADEFAYSVDIDDDTIVIGAPQNDLEGGSAYVFRRGSDNIWKEQDVVMPNARYTEFGYAVSLDGNRIYVGAPYDDKNDAGVGVVYELFTPLRKLDDGASSLQVQSISPVSSPPSSSLSPSSAPNIASPVFLISSGRVREQVDHESICKSEFGSEWKVADWEYDIKALAEADVTQLMNLLGILPIDSNLEASDPLWGDGYYVTNDRNKYVDASQRVYNFQYIAGGAPSWFAVHDSYADGLFLGSWYDIERYVLCKNSEAEFLSFFDPIDGYTFVGKGCCRNSEETLIPSNTIYEANDIEECAKSCKEKYSLDDSFVGINFLSQPTWALCNCMMDEKNNGAITYADTGGCGDELCYSYNDPTISLLDSSCTDVEFGFNIKSDQYPEETTWTLSKVNDTEVILRGFADKRYTEYQYETTMCLENTQYEFTIYDSFGDGLTEGGQYNVTVGGTVIMEGGDFLDDEMRARNTSILFSIPFTEISPSPSTSMLPTHQPSMSLMPSTTSSPTLSFSPSYSPSVSMSPTSCFDLGINVTSNTIWALSLVSNINGTRDELIIDNSPVKLRVNGLLYSAAIFNSDYGVITKNATGILCDCGLGMSQCDCQEEVCLIEQGDGDFSDQISNCENGGGIAAVIYSNVPGLVTPQYLHDGTAPDISTVYISQENGHYLLNNEIGTTVEVSVLEDAPNAEESLCLTRGEYHFTYYREYYCYDDDCYYNITIGGEMVIQGEMQSEEEINIPFSIPFVASTSPSVSPSWAFFPSISPSITTQPTQITSSLPSISPTSSLSPTNTPSVMPSIDCSDDVRAEIIILSDQYPGELSWTISRTIRSNIQIVFEQKVQDSNDYNEHALCLPDGKYNFTISDSFGDGITNGGYYKIEIEGVMIASGSGKFVKDVVPFSIPYIGTAAPSKAPTSSSPTSVAPTLSPTTTTSPTEFIPLIDGFTFQGKGSCRNSDFLPYERKSIDGEDNAGACVEACNEAFSLDESFVGVNFYEDQGWCDCLIDDNGEKGKITGAQPYGVGVGYEVILCYSYNGYSPSTTAVGDTSLPTYPPTTPSIDTIEPNSSSLNPLSSPPSSSSSISPAVVAVELRTKRVRHHSLPEPVQEKKNALDE